MTFHGLLLDNFTVTHWAELLLRIVVATLCGSIIGLERSRRFKDAGIRTHSVVACTAALLMIVSKYGFADLSQGDLFFPGVRGGDPSRIAAQVPRPQLQYQRPHHRRRDLGCRRHRPRHRRRPLPDRHLHFSLHCHPAVFHA